MPAPHPETLVSTDWLAQHLNAPDIHVVDGSFKMPGVTPTAHEDYLAGHIPGAVFFDIDAISDGDSPLPHMLPSPEKFASRMRKLGLGDGDRIVLYGSSLAGPARAWWTFRAFGHQNVVILDGGFKKWLAEGCPSDDLASSPRDRHFTARFDSLLVRDKAQVQANIAEPKAQLLDARAKGRFEGTAPEPRAGLRSGHIPGSLHLDHLDLVDAATGLVKPAEAIEAAFEAAGIDLAKPVITTCGSGVTASVLALGLHLIGHRDTAVYDGSWSEWGLPGDHPIETGPARR
jgi:thiosulfate/3-mercaptopyruvate sulfurtransferase